MPRCGDHMWSDTGSNHEVVHLKSVIAIDSEDKAAIRDSDQRQQQQFDRAMVPFYNPEEIGHRGTQKKHLPALLLDLNL